LKVGPTTGGEETGGEKPGRKEGLSWGAGGQTANITGGKVGGKARGGNGATLWPTYSKKLSKNGYSSNTQQASKRPLYKKGTEGKRIRVGRKIRAPKRG